MVSLLETRVGEEEEIGTSLGALPAVGVLLLLPADPPLLGWPTLARRVGHWPIIS